MTLPNMPLPSVSLPSLLAVHAHPDDESLFSGGVLAQHAAAGARTAVVTTTWVEGSHRVIELARALEILGAGAPRLLGYADARVPESAPGGPGSSTRRWTRRWGPWWATSVPSGRRS
ncbi:1D-myo-inositol 2-acetamido-2-deoxy-alpha-D-glucopyranoside deacetylase [Streptomyces microflavus]